MERFYGRSTYLFTPVSLPNVGRTFSLQAFTLYWKRKDDEIEPEHWFTQIREGSLKISLRRFDRVAEATERLLSVPEVKRGRKKVKRRWRQRNSLTRAVPQTTRIFCMSYQIARGSDIRNAMHDFIVHCHTSRKCYWLGETRGSFKILRLSNYTRRERNTRCTSYGALRR